MFEKNKLKQVSLITSIINIVILLFLKFANVKVSLFGFTEKEGVGALGIASDYSIGYLILIVAILCIAIHFKDSLNLDFNSKIVELALPVVGFIVNILVLFYVKSKLKSDVGSLFDFGEYASLVSSGVSFNATLGFYLSQVCYVVMFGAALIGSGDIDLGNEKLNSFVKEASSVTENLTEKAINVTSDITEKAINKASETIKDIKESNEEVNDEVVEEEVERVEVVEEATIEVEEIVDEQPEDTIEE